MASVSRMPCPTLRSRTASSVQSPRVHAMREESKASRRSLLSSLPALVLPLVALPASSSAGVLSGSSGLESFNPFSSLPIPEDRAASQRDRYREREEIARSSPLAQELLERSRKNKDLRRREIQSKYCARGAEWGVGDCAVQGMAQEEKDAFIAAVKKEGEDVALQLQQQQ